MPTVGERVRAIKIEIPKPATKADISPLEKQVLSSINSKGIRSAGKGWAHTAGNTVSKTAINRLLALGLVVINTTDDGRRSISITAAGVEALG